MGRLSTGIVILCLGLAGCASDTTLLGYHIGSQARKDIKTLRVPIFRNTTYYRDLEYELTEAVIKRIQDTTPYKVVTEGPADAQLVGTIRLGNTHTMIQNELNESRLRDFALAVEVNFIDTRTGQDYFLPVTIQPAIPPESQAAPNSNLPIPGVLPGPLAPTGPKGIIVTRHASFAQELGHSYATAKQKVLGDLAIHIVNMMETPW